MATASTTSPRSRSRTSSWPRSGAPLRLRRGRARREEQEEEEAQDRTRAGGGGGGRSCCRPPRRRPRPPLHRRCRRSRRSRRPRPRAGPGATLTSTRCASPRWRTGGRSTFPRSRRSPLLRRRCSSPRLCHLRRFRSPLCLLVSREASPRPKRRPAPRGFRPPRPPLSPRTLPTPYLLPRPRPRRRRRRRSPRRTLPRCSPRCVRTRRTTRAAPGPSCGRPWPDWRRRARGAASTTRF